MCGPAAWDQNAGPDDAVRAADVVVTMGCGDSTVHLPGKRYENWPVADPALAPPEGVRAMYGDLAARVPALAADLIAPTHSTSTEEAA